MLSLLMLPLLLLILPHFTQPLDNGVALSPPMGWLSWERFECNTNCLEDPDNCISERLLKQTADAMVKNGMRDAGYRYVAVDDCWMARERNSSTGRIMADPERFPSGMPALADYIHSKGLLLGVYGDIGRHTCAGFPGSHGNIDLDARTFAEMGVDMLKFDGCAADIDDYNRDYPAMAQALNRTGQHIVYSCEWPMYAGSQGGKVDYALVAHTCNMFRDLTDIYDSWGSVIGMIDYFGDDVHNQSHVAGPGAWNDPDQLVIGNFGLSPDQERVQMALYAILASPLLVSCDLRKLRPSSLETLTNQRLIAVNQDALGRQGHRVINRYDKISVWRKEVLPKGSYAVALLNTNQGRWPKKVSFPILSFLPTQAAIYNVTELFEGKSMGLYKSIQNFTSTVNPTGVKIYKFTHCS